MAQPKFRHPVNQQMAESESDLGPRIADAATAFIGSWRFLVIQSIFEIVKMLNEKEGITVLLVEQNAGLALGIAQYGYVLEIGRIVLEDTGENLRRNEAVRRSYLGY